MRQGMQYLPLRDASALELVGGVSLGALFLEGWDLGDSDWVGGQHDQNIGNWERTVWIKSVLNLEETRREHVKYSNM